MDLEFQVDGSFLLYFQNTSSLPMTSMVSAEKPAVLNHDLPIGNESFFLWLFSRYLLHLKISVVCLCCVWVWISFSLSCLGCIQLLECVSLYLSLNLGKFSVMISSNIFPASHSFCLLGFWCNKHSTFYCCATCPRGSVHFFSLHGLQWIISIYRSSGSLILCHSHSANESHPLSFLVWFF